MDLVVFPTPRDAELALAREIADLVRARERVVLGLATGRTPVGVYAELVRMHRAEGLSFARVVAFHLDELEGVAPDDPASFQSFLRAHLLDHVDVDPRNVHFLSPRDGDAEEACAAYEAAIDAAGGIDLQLLGLGLNGHVGFNEPGSPADSRTRRVALHPVTRSAYGPLPSGGPTHALTLGIATIRAARALRLLALGERKAAIVAELFRGAQRAELPATFLHDHPDARLLVDEAAAAAPSREPRGTA